MDDEKILKEIKDSGEDIEIPEGLSPETMKKRFVSREKKISIRRYGAWAAAAIVLLVSAAVAVPVLRDRAGEETEVSDERTEATGEKTAGNGIFHIEAYQDLYDMVKDYDTKTKAYDASAADGTAVAEGFAVSSESDAGMIEEIAQTDEVVSSAYGSSGMEESYVEESGSTMSGSSAGDMETTSLTDGSTGQGADYSSTNIQEEGVEEADIVKTDGRYIYALGQDGTIRIVETAAGNADADTGAGDSSMKVTGEISLETGTGAQVEEMYVEGDLLQVITSSYEYISAQGSISMSDDSQIRSYYDVPVRVTTVTTYDITDRSDPQKTDSYRQDGAYLTSRKSGEYLYLFTAYTPQAGPDADHMEYYVPYAGSSVLLCEEIYLPAMDSSWEYDGNRYLVASSLKNDAASAPADRIAVVSGGETFYVSQKNVYAATQTWDEDQEYTDLVRIAYKDGRFTPGNSGRVPGYLNDNFSMDEYEDHLRVVTTVNKQVTDTGSQKDQIVTASISRSNGLYILDENMEITGKIENLAQDETIQSARFMGDTGYFVTYRNMDPLFSADLSDPENPRILGELKITGFSQYLHFYGEGKLLGIGWETDPDSGETKGLKCSMFDISDPADVKETDKLVLGNVGSCAALDNYKMILANPGKNLFGFAYTVYDTDTWEEHYYYGVFSYTEDMGFKTLEYLPVSGDMAENYYDYEWLRGIYIGSTFYLAGEHGIESYDMEQSFKKTGEVMW